MLRKVLTLTAILAFALALTAGCAKKAEQETGKVPSQTQTAEMADSTRMDTATQMMDTTGAATDTMGGEAAGN